MILDKLLQFDAAATAASGIVVTTGVDSTNTLDLLNARDLAIKGERSLQIVFTVGTVFAASGGAASLQIRIYGSVDNSTFTLYGQTDQIPKANLLANTVIRFPLPPQASNPQAAGIPRYLKLNYLAITNSFTSGTFECDLVIDPQANNAPTYPSGFTVSN